MAADDDGSTWGDGATWEDMLKCPVEVEDPEPQFMEMESAAYYPAPRRISAAQDQPPPVFQSEETQKLALFYQELNSSTVPPPSEEKDFGRDLESGNDKGNRSKLKEEDPFNDHAARRQLMLNRMHPLDVNETGRIFGLNNPFSRNHLQGRLPQLPDQPLTNPERRELRKSRSGKGEGMLFSGGTFVRRLDEIERILEEREARQRAERKGPLALKSAGYRSIEEPDDWTEDLGEDFNDEQQMDVDEESVPLPSQPPGTMSSLKRSLHQEEFAVHRLGDPAGRVEFHSFGRKAKAVEIPVTDDVTEPIRLDFDVEEFETEPSTSSENIASINPMEAGITSEGSMETGAASVDVPEVEIASMDPVEVDSRKRTVMFPPSSNKRVAELWKPLSKDELGTIPLPCCCKADTVPYSVLNVSPAERCQAIFRNRDARLMACRERCDPKNSSGLNWLPQCEQIIALCPSHAEILRKHQVCPFCNEFYSEESKSEFVVCTGQGGSETHLYHLDCRRKMQMEKCCPHCLLDKVHTLERPFSIVQQSCRKPVNPFDGGYSGLLDDLVPRMCHFRPEWELEPVVGFFAHGEYQVFVNAMEEAQRRYSNDANEAILWCLQKLLPATRGSFPSIKAINEQGETFLHKAVEAGSTGAVLLLCQLPIDTSAHDSSGQTALIKAVGNGDPGVIHAMVRSGCDPNLPDIDGRTPLHHAAYHKNFKAMHFFLENGANGNLKDVDGYAVIFSALEWISAAQLLDLITLSVNLEVVDREKGWSPLHWIAFLGRNDLVPLFFDLEHHFAWADDDGNTPAHIAVIYGNHEFFEVLLSCRNPPLLWKDNREGKSELQLAETEHGTDSEMCETVARYCRVFPEKTSAAMERIGFLGVISGDISQGKSDAPIPAVNFTNVSRFPGELTYSDITLKAPISQMYKKKWDPRPCFRADLEHQGRNCDFQDCFTSGCRCVSHYIRKNGVPLFAPFCDLCKDAGEPQCIDYDKTYKMQYHNCPVAGFGFLVYEGIPMARHKPELTEAAAQTVMKRLEERADDYPEAADEMLFLRDLVEVSSYHRTSRSRRSRSARRPRRASPVLDKRSESEPPRKARNIRSLDECKRILKDDGFEEATTVHSAPKLQQPEDELLYEYFHNPIDMLSEIEEYRVDEILRGSVLRFDRLHPLVRWDLTERTLDRKQEHPVITVPSTVSSPDKEVKADWDRLVKMHECSALCECGPQCQMHITGRLPVARMAMYNFGQPVGWGVIALNRIIAGTVIAEYTGEIYNAGTPDPDKDGLSLYNEDSYIFELSVQGSTALVDAKRVGNVTRFFNHSCKANVHAQEVRQHGSWPRIVLFATRTIYPTEQLTLNYGDKWWSEKQKNDKLCCRCGEATCRYSKEATKLAKQKGAKNSRGRGRGRGAGR